MTSNPVAALEIGTSKTVALVGEMRDDRQIVISGVGESPSYGMRMGEVTDLEKARKCVRDALSKAEESSNVEIVQVYLAISGGHISSVSNRGTISVANPQAGIAVEDIDEVMDIARNITLPTDQEVLHTICRHFMIDGQASVTSPAGMVGSQLSVEMLILHGIRSRLQNAVRLVQGLPMDVDDIAFSGLCSSLAVLTQEQKKAGVVVVDLGGGTTDYLAYSEGVVATAGALGLGGDHITNDITMTFNIPTLDAEMLKRELGSAIVTATAGQRAALKGSLAGQPQPVSLKDLHMVINARMEEIFALVRMRLDRHGVLPHVSGGIVLTGGGALLKGVEDLARKTIGVRCTVGRPRNIGGLSSTTSGPEYSTVCGLVQYAFRSAAVPQRTQAWPRGLFAGRQPTKPPQADFDKKANDCRAEVNGLIGEELAAANDGYNQQLEAIIADSNEACKAHDDAGWNDCFIRLIKLCDKVHAQRKTRDDTPPPPEQVLLSLMMSLTQLRSKAEQDGRLDELQSEFDAAATELQAIDPDAGDLWMKIRNWYESRFEPIEIKFKERKSAVDSFLLSQPNSILPSDIPLHNAVPAPKPHLQTMPCPITDLVHFSITSPPVVTCNQTYLMDVWAHLERQRQEVIQRAKEEADGKEIRIKSRGPVKLARGNVLTVSPRIAGFAIDPPQDTIAWEGEIGNVQFTVSVPGEAVIGDHPGICDFHVNGLKISSLRFMVTVGTRVSQRESLAVQEKRAKRAFASYASEDRDSVLARIQGLEKGIPDLEVFLDVVSLRSGQRWRERLRDEVLSRDLLYLFWSQAASESEWVDWEWRCVYDQKGIEFIDPVPLVSPNVVPPPPELADLHFNDWVLAYMRTEGSPGHGGASPPPETFDKGQT